MDRKTLAERLRALAANDEKRSKTARLRDVLDDVEVAFAAGARRADVLAELEAQGLRMSLATFETTLKRLRAQRTRETATPRASQAQKTNIAAPAVKSTAEPNPITTEEQASHDPADLDRIIATQPDLTALARLAKRSRK